jgi:hypothetical protein
VETRGVTYNQGAEVLVRGLSHFILGNDPPEEDHAQVNLNNGKLYEMNLLTMHESRLGSSQAPKVVC